MKKYNFQINDRTKHTFWDEVPVKCKCFTSWEQAVSLAKRTARFYKTVVRLTEGNYPLRASGSYFHGGIKN